MSEKDPSIPTNLLELGVIAAKKRAAFFAKSDAAPVEVAVVQPVAATSSVEAAPVTPVIATPPAEAPKGVSPDATANIDAQLAGGKNISGRRAAKRAVQGEKPVSSEPPKKKKSHAREIVEFKDEVSAISKRKTEWIEKIEKVTTRDELSAITKEARKNGSSGKMPYFFLGKFLDGLLKKYDAYSDDMKNELKAAAEKSQEEVAGVYLMKRADVDSQKAFGLLPKDLMVEEGRAAALSLEEEEHNLPQLLKFLEEQRDRMVAKIHAITSQREHQFFFEERISDDFLKDLFPIYSINSREGEEKVRNLAASLNDEIENEYRVRGEELAKEADARASVTDEEYQFSHLPESTLVLYQSNKGVISVERRGDMYQITDTVDGDSGFTYTEEYLQSIAKAEGWVEIKTTYDPADLRTMPRGGEVGLAIAELEAKVEEMRLQFVTIDYKEASVWKKLKSIFGKHVDEAKSLDRESCRQSYEHALMELQEAKLEELRQQGLAGKELKEAMAGLLRYFRYDERVELYNIRTQVRLEDPSKNYGVKAVEFFETLGREYNKLTKWQKLAIGGTVVLSAGALAFAGGVVGGVLATGMVGARRIVTGVAAGVALDGMFEAGSESIKKWNESYSGRVVGKWVDKNPEGELSEENWQKIDRTLKNQIKELERKFQFQKREALWRKAAAFGIGLGAGYFGHILAEKAGLSGGGQSGSGVGEGKGAGTPRAEAPQRMVSGQIGDTSGAQSGTSTAAAPASAAEAARAPASGVGAPQGADQSQIKAVPAEGAGVKPEAASEEAGKPKAQPAVKPEVVDPEKPEQELLKDHKVTLADSKKGLWGVLEKRFLPADISKPAGNRVVQSLENLIQQKLDAMTPEARAEAGFPTGRIDMIQRGGVIRFDDLLSAQEIQEVLEGKDIEAPQTITMEPAAVGGEAEPSLENTPATPDITDTRTEAPGDIPGDTLKDTSEGMKGLPSRELEDSSVDIPAEPKTVAEFDVQRNLSNPKEFLMEHPELKGKLFETVGKVRQGIFVLSPRLDGVLPEQDYLSNREKLGGMKVSQVLKDLGNPSGVNHELNPLHNDQMKALGKFVNAAEKSFGPVISQPGAGENIDSYTSRMATMAVRTGKAIRGFYKP